MEQKNFNETYRRWREEPLLSEEEKSELRSIEGQEGEIMDRFALELEFGTAGLRGVMGLGTNRMNIYTIRKTTQGLANHLLKTAKNPSVAIAYDSRHNSHDFACEAAKVLAGNKVNVCLYREMTPTPSLSYAVRRLGCAAGIVITASHNPKQYNGYKVYGSDGCQIDPKTADQIIEEIAAIDIFKDVIVGDFDKSVYNGRITFIEDELLNEFIESDLKQSLWSASEGKRTLKIAYTPLNGTGLRCIREALAKDGFKPLDIVREQIRPDGDFTTCPYPNPEMKEALTLGVQLMLEKKDDILIATDPDCDRVGVVVNKKNRPVYLTGNEMGMLLLDFIYHRRKTRGTLPTRPVLIKTIVTSELLNIYAEDHDIEVIDCLTGFKFICGEMRKLEEEGRLSDFILGFEESVGYLTNPDIRDKDAVNAVILIAEMADHYKKKGMTLVDRLEELYHHYGHFRTETLNFYFEGLEGKDRMSSLMKDVRDGVIAKELGDAITSTGDYLLGTITTANGTAPTGLPVSNVVKYFLKDRETITLRPSGTEPKLKCYIFAKNARRLRKYKKLVRRLTD